jgi:hypothetical protein
MRGDRSAALFALAPQAAWIGDTRQALALYRAKSALKLLTELKVRGQLL